MEWKIITDSKVYCSIKDKLDLLYFIALPLTVTNLEIAMSI